MDGEGCKNCGGLLAVTEILGGIGKKPGELGDMRIERATCGACGATFARRKSEPPQEWDETAAGSPQAPT